MHGDISADRETVVRVHEPLSVIDLLDWGSRTHSWTIPAALERIARGERGVLVSLGHSTASYDTAVEAITAGARLVTHCFNGMGPLHHREPGLIGAALTDDRVAVSLITDLIHVHPAVVSLIFRAKTAHRVALVTDAVAWEGDGDAPRLPDRR